MPFPVGLASSLPVARAEGARSAIERARVVETKLIRMVPPPERSDAPRLPNVRAAYTPRGASERGECALRHGAHKSMVWLAISLVYSLARKAAGSVDVGRACQAWVKCAFPPGSFCTEPARA